MDGRVRMRHSAGADESVVADESGVATPVITPPMDFQDILEPPAIFGSTSERGRIRPRTELFSTAQLLHYSKCVFPPWPVAPLAAEAKPAVAPGGASDGFDAELERLKSHSLRLKFPATGRSSVQYHSSVSILQYSAYRIRTEEVTESFRSAYAVSETESEDDDDDAAAKDVDDADDADDATPHLRRRASARLSTCSGLSASLLTSSSDADADSGIDGVSPRLSVAAFGETTLSPSHSILYIDSVSARNSVVAAAEGVDGVALPAQRQPTPPPAPPLPDGADDVITADVTSDDVRPNNDEGIGPRASMIEGDPRRDRSYRTAMELLHTERTYVDVLHLLDQVFQFRIDQENRVHNMFGQELIPQMFSNIKSLFKLHHDFLLPRLEERMCHWDTERRIGDIMTNFAPFLKMYAEYVRNFDHATHLLSTMTLKSSRFAAIIEDIQQMPQCRQLSLQHHMLTPIQRVPRYEMLLRDYLRRLPEDSPDRPDTEKALHLVSTAAMHANEAMQKIDQFKQLLEIQESLGRAVDLVSPTREFLKEGKIIKISARSGDHQERYLFLFTDVLLLCSPRLISNRVIGVGLTPYRLRARFNIALLEVLEGDNLETANTFYLREGSKTVELYTSTSDEKEAWIDALFAAMTELTRRKSSLRTSPVQQASPTSSVNGSATSSQPSQFPSPSAASVAHSDRDALGKTAPTLVRMDLVNRCSICHCHFTVMRRKHHCHSCGQVMCNRCSSNKTTLAYDTSKAFRVCDGCFDTLTSKAPSSTSQPSSESSTAAGTSSPVSSPVAENNPSSTNYRTGLLEVKVEAASVLSGYLLLKTRGKTWNKRWFALRSDFVLYSYRSHQGESRAMTATPVPGFTVSLLSGCTASSSSCSSSLVEGASPSHKPCVAVASPAAEVSTERDRSFKMAHVHKSYLFQAATRQEAERWTQFLQMAARADLPSPT